MAGRSSGAGPRRRPTAAPAPSSASAVTDASNTIGRESTIPRAKSSIMRKGLTRWSAAATAGDRAVASSAPSSSDAKNSANDSAPAIT